MDSLGECMGTGVIVSCDRHFYGSVQNTEGVVTSVYRHSLNFTDGMDLYAVVTEKHLCAPYTAVLSVLDFQTLSIRPGDRVVCENGVLNIGKHVKFDMSGCRIYDMCFSVQTADLQIVKRKLAEYENWLKKEQVAAGCASFYLQYYCHSKNKVNGVQGILNERLAELAERIEENQRIGSVLEKVLGAGYGLTPSGDDFLCGFMAAQSCGGKSQNRILREIIGWLMQQDLSKCTTAVSAQMIRAALLGERPILYQKLLLAFLGVSGNLPDMLWKIKSVGHSSGMDYASGIASGLRLLDRA